MKSSPAPVPTDNYSLMRVINAADRVIPEQPMSHPQAEALARQREMLMCGIGFEMPAIRPSYPELATVMGWSHQTCMSMLRRWQAMQWQDRYNWMTLVHRRLRDEETPVDAVVHG
jgi:hypothetical protein